MVLVFLGYLVVLHFVLILFLVPVPDAISVYHSLLL